MANYELFGKGLFIVSYVIDIDFCALFIATF